MNIRRAVRALVVDHDHRVLLVHLEFANWTGWVLPGGGVEEGEDDHEAIRRELSEEVGLLDAEIVGPLWERTVLFDAPVRFDGQNDRIFFVRCARFEPTPHLSWDDLRSEGVRDIRWWTRQELAATTETLAPRRLVALLDAIDVDGLPPTIVDISD